MQDSFLIPELVKEFLNDHSKVRACGSCAIGCNDLVRFICCGFSINDLDSWSADNKDKVNQIIDTFWESLE